MSRPVLSIERKIAMPQHAKSHSLGIVLASLLATSAFAGAAQAQTPASGGVAGGVRPQAVAAGWSVLLKVENPATGWKQRSVRFGLMPDAQVGYDRHDLPSMTPFSAPYLYIAFPHPEWGAKAGTYATDFRQPQSAFGATATSWKFDLHASPASGVVYLGWEGDPAVLQRSTVTDTQTGLVYKAADPALGARGIAVTVTAETRSFIWTFQP